jgi:threonine-phosphate decarboxylase
VPEERILDFSSNINPMGLPRRAAERMAREAKDPATWARYPDPELAELRSALCGYAGVAPESIVIAAGADSLIHAAVRALAPRRCVIPVPAFSEYDRACRAAGCGLAVVPLNEDFSVDRETLRLVRAGDLMILNNPHNPSGLCATRREMIDRIEVVRAFGAAILADEAFIDYVPETSITRLAATMDEVVAIRSLTKFFGCPGLRVGYAVASPQTVSKITAQLPPWPVTTLAANTLAEALQDATYLTDAREQNRLARESFSTALSKLGCRVFPGAANFLLFCVPAGVSATVIRQQLIQEEAILVRDCGSFAGLEGGHYLRVAVRRDDENQRLIDALTRILRETSCLQTHS